MKERFFSYTGEWAGYDRHETAGAARAAVHAAIDQLDEDWDPVDADLWCWGELRESVVVEVVHTHTDECADEDGCPEGFPFDQEGDECADCSLVPVPDTEAERLRAELADLRTRVGAAIAIIRYMEAHHRQAVSSPAHGGYSFERAEAYEHAADLLTEAIETPADERAGGEE